ncbi:vivid PAS VVD [Fusarium beomiforme]|uniref:Vivid PAS VVD n=1 Tax=Fusarium beomiforme TaxID=44412 RepID=A0A9P5AGC2_9HYPO|nr:vivid PAS VVD [Fusarium beomiforme]
MAPKAAQVMNPWEVNALNYEFPQEDSFNVDGTVNSAGTWRRVQDPVIYPGLYAPSGIDIMSILFRVMGRPNPQVVLGPVDCSVALVVCDMGQPDAPVIYVSDSFSELTGYTTHEVLGRNCRFLQAPPGQERALDRKGSDKVASHRMRQAVFARKEIQIPVTNYKKYGQPFNNLLTIIPVPVDETGCRYCIGFLSEMD